MREKVLEIKGLNKAFGKKQIIHNLNLTVYAGEILGFLGPNGSGKTTTIKMVMGFLTPDQGEISICGMSVKKNYEEAMGLVGGIVENPEMYIEFTGRKNLEMYARIHDHVPPEQIEAAVKLVKAENYIDEKVKKYSLGMKQRGDDLMGTLDSPDLIRIEQLSLGQADALGVRRGCVFSVAGRKLVTGCGIAAEFIGHLPQRFRVIALQVRPNLCLLYTSRLQRPQPPANKQLRRQCRRMGQVAAGWKKSPVCVLQTASLL